MTTIAVIDGMGGGIGCEIISRLKKESDLGINIIALGINAVATDRMMQAKANKGASGENAIKCNINSADIIAGPLGIIMPNGLMGEVTKDIAEIIMSARGKKILIPVSHNNLTIIGLESNNQLSVQIENLVKEIIKISFIK